MNIVAVQSLHYIINIMVVSVSKIASKDIHIYILTMQSLNYVINVTIKSIVKNGFRWYL